MTIHAGKHKGNVLSSHNREYGKRYELPFFCNIHKPRINTIHEICKIIRDYKFLTYQLPRVCDRFIESDDTRRYKTHPLSPIDARLMEPNFSLFINWWICDKDIWKLYIKLSTHNFSNFLPFLWGSEAKDWSSVSLIRFDSTFFLNDSEALTYAHRSVNNSNWKSNKSIY